ncbi:MAG: hypothetical protein H0U86_10585 [Chloroflexi bacterium]|nr:hypothetical protein [Chloroflexota bacterium]
MPLDDRERALEVDLRAIAGREGRHRVGVERIGAVGARQVRITAEKGVANGYAPLDSGILVPTAYLGTGTADGSKFLRGDRVWAIPPGSALGAWTSYTPTWTCSGTAPSLGNGSLSGRYKLLDANTCLIHMAFSAGSATTFGTGNFFFALPFTAASQGIQLMACHILDSGTDNKIGVAFQIIPEGGNVVSNTVPMTWANGDQINISGSYEI